MHKPVAEAEVWAFGSSHKYVNGGVPPVNEVIKISLLQIGRVI